MQNDILMLILGAVLGFLSALLLEFFKNRLENKRVQQERAWDAKEEKEKEIREFLVSTGRKNTLPAWLTLVETNNTLSLFQRKITDDAMSMPLSGEIAGDGGNISDKPALDKYLLTQTQIVGRQEDCEIHLSDSTVSRKHAMIRYEDGYFAIYDLGSRSGTFVNNTKVAKDGTALHFSDRVQIGESVFIFDGLGSDQQRSEDKNARSKITQPPRMSRAKNKK